MTFDYWTLYEAPADSPKKWAVRVPTESGKGKTVLFGARGYEDFTTHHDVDRRERYRTRHQRDRLDDPYAPGFWSMWVLWGESDDLETAFADAVKRAKKILGESVRRNPGSSSLSKAEASWRMWHQKEPRELHEVSYQFPSHVFCVGTAETIVYASDKWEKDGKFFDYVHEFDSRPEVFMVDGQRRNPAAPPSSVKKLLGTRDLEGELALPILGHVKEIIISPPDDAPDHCIRFRDNPIMCCTADHKTVIVFSETKGPIFIRGGKMVVTERGIVR